MNAKFALTLGLVAASALLPAAEPGYLNIVFNKIRPGQAQARRDFLAKADAQLDPAAEPGTRYVRLRKAYPIGGEHGYHALQLTFRAEPGELDPARIDPARSLTAFLKARGMTREQYNSWFNGIFDADATRSRMYRELASIGGIEAGDWVRVNWLRAAPGKRQALREANVKYFQETAKKHIERGEEKAWMVYERHLFGAEQDFDFFRVHVFKDSKSAQKSFAGTPQMLGPADFANMRDLLRDATAAGRVELYQVEHVREGKK